MVDSGFSSSVIEMGVDGPWLYEFMFVMRCSCWLAVCVQVKKNYEALRQREEEERMVQSSPSRGGEDAQVLHKWEKESQEATRELLKVKDRLIEVERNVSEPTAPHQIAASPTKHHRLNPAVQFRRLSLATLTP